METPSFVEMAESNFKEAQRQLEKAEKDHRKGSIDDHRLDDLRRLREVAAEDLRRCIKES
ncbi:hypothetical protein [Arthrobacter roseus]|uniref:hypothetical protein n=1 Tax=Arthrobacter roseus TaxID=136274 RepID=UPI0019649286|nr:hypothetical protein [Arthrobacter roseus]MBM7848819.1 hypothetical protein [Arthrobacter roseus]